MSLRSPPTCDDQEPGGLSGASSGMPVLKKIGIGMVVGLIAPFLIMVQAFTFPRSWDQLRMIVLFGPVFGGSMAYFLHRFRSVERSRGEFAWFVLAGALAGGATAGIAFDFDYLPSPWLIPAGFFLGGVGIAFFWWTENS